MGTMEFSTWLIATAAKSQDSYTGNTAAEARGDTVPERPKSLVGASPGCGADAETDGHWLVDHVLSF